MSEGSLPDVDHVCRRRLSREGLAEDLARLCRVQVPVEHGLRCPALPPSCTGSCSQAPMHPEVVSRMSVRPLPSTSAAMAFTTSRAPLAIPQVPM